MFGFMKLGIMMMKIGRNNDDIKYELGVVLPRKRHCCCR